MGSRESFHTGKGVVRPTPVQILTPHTCPEGSVPDLEEEDTTELEATHHQGENQRHPIERPQASFTPLLKLLAPSDEFEPKAAEDP